MRLTSPDGGAVMFQLREPQDGIESKYSSASLSTHC